MDTEAKGLLGAVSGKARAGDKDPWWDGRQVAIRPDVPGPAFDPEDLVLIRSDTERVAAQTRIDRSVDGTKRKSSKDLWPQWLWDADDTAADADEETR